MDLPRLYVAGPMTGIPEMNYPMFFRVEETLKASGYDVLNPARIDEVFANELVALKSQDLAPDWSWYMRKTLRMMLLCDGVATLANYTESRGATIEVNLARALGFRVAAWSAWVIEANRGGE
jgi:hypothetical protein